MSADLCLDLASSVVIRREIFSSDRGGEPVFFRESSYNNDLYRYLENVERPFDSKSAKFWMPIDISSGLMASDRASVLVNVGMVSVLLFSVLTQRARQEDTSHP